VAKLFFERELGMRTRFDEVEISFACLVVALAKTGIPVSPP
jgi:hypothetical protein